MEDQTIPNEARLEVGVSWADFTELEAEATLEDIEKVLTSYH